MPPRDGRLRIRPDVHSSVLGLRIGYISQWFPPEPVGPPFWIAQGLLDAGHLPEVLTGIPNYPTGRVATGYRAHCSVRERIGGMTVHRVPLYPSHDASVTRRVANYGSFAASATLAGRHILSRCDVTVAYGSPITAALPSMLARRTSEVPYVLLVQDLWPDSVFATGYLTGGITRRAAAAWLNHFVSAAYRGAEHIVVISPGMRRVLIERGVPPAKVSVVYNWSDDRQLQPVAPTGALRRRLGLADSDRILLYAGNHGSAQGLDAWIDAMALTRERPRTHLVLVGEGADRERLVARAGHSGIDRVQFLPPVPSSQLPELAAEADALVISLADHSLFDVTVPGKTQTCLALGKPIVASGRGDLARILAESGAGWAAHPGDPQAIARIIRRVDAADRAELSARGTAGLRFYERTMSRRIGVERLDTILRNAAGATTPKSVHEDADRVFATGR